MAKTTKILICAQDDVLEAIDNKRGRLTRSGYLNNLLWKVLVEDRNNSNVDKTNAKV